MANISDFKAQLTGGGARANQFRVELTFPSFVTLGVVAGQQAQFLCKSAQLPASTVENFGVQYRGRAVNFAGERSFAPWSIQVYNDTNFNIRNAMEQWSNGIQNLAGTQGLTNPRDYQVDLSVHQLDRNGAIVKSYKFIDAYPTEIGTIELDYDTVNAIETFPITFQYNYWTSNTSTGGGGIGVNVSIDTPIGSFPI
jgi:T4-like virus tail tube protein gp19